MEKIFQAIASNRDAVLELWRSSFGEEMVKGMCQQSAEGNRFTASVPYLMNECTDRVVSWLVEEGETPVPESLIDFCRLQAIQQKSPSQAIGFIFHLKDAVSGVLGTSGTWDTADYLAVGAKVDQLAMHVFDWYVEFRERIYLIRIDEMQRGEDLMRRRLAAQQSLSEREMV